MSRSLNRITLIGNLGADPEVRQLPSGVKVCEIRVATSESYKDKNDEWKEETEWHRVSLWERLAEIAEQYLKKGSKVYIEGKVKTRSYQKDNETKYFTEVRALSMIMLDSPKKEGTYSPRQSQPAESLGVESYSVEDEVPF